MKFTEQLPATPKSEPSKPFWERDIQLFPSKINLREKELIYRQLGILHQSGVDIRSSFEILFAQIKRAHTRERLTSVLDEVIRGKSLSDALSIFPDFSPYEVYSLRIGEETGQLGLVFDKLAGYFENQIAQRRQIVSALSYPLLIVFTSVAAVSFMVLFIIPMFEEVFLRFNSQLPALTGYVIRFSKAFRAYGPFILVLVFLVLFTMRWFRHHRQFQYWQERLWLKIPIAGEIYRQVYMARFCDAMGLLIGSSVPMVTTLEMVSKMIGLQHIERTLLQVQTDLIQGKTITQSFQKHPIFDAQMVALIKVGEEVNQLGTFFQKLATNYADAVRHRIGLMATFLEPLMIVFLGLVVGVILVAMYLPMFELSSGMDFGN